MAKASIALPNGTAINIDGTPEEIAILLALYGQDQVHPTGGKGGATGAKTPKIRRARSRKSSNDLGHVASTGRSELSSAQLTEIVNAVKSCAEAESIEKNILDKISQVNRTLLPLYTVHEYLDKKHGLTSGDISKITTQLGIPISQANASRTLSGTASRYVMSDSVRKKGTASRYTLSRRGQQYLKAVIAGRSHEVKE